EGAHFRLIGSPRRFSTQLRGELRQRLAAWLAGQPFGAAEGVSRGGYAVRREAVRASQLIQVGPRHREAGGPDEPRLVLDVQVVEMHQLGGVDLVLRQQRTRQ